ncbi:unnamed protein product, partial [Rangifer tarandus platyrhynchus]
MTQHAGWAERWLCVAPCTGWVHGQPHPARGIWPHTDLNAESLPPQMQPQPGHEERGFPKILGSRTGCARRAAFLCRLGSLPAARAPLVLLSFCSWF